MGDLHHGMHEERNSETHPRPANIVAEEAEMGDMPSPTTGERSGNFDWRYDDPERSEYWDNEGSRTFYADKIKELINVSADGIARIKTKHLLHYFGNERRGSRVNEQVNAWLSEHGLEFTTAFNNFDYYGSAQIKLKSDKEDSSGDIPNQALNMQAGTHLSTAALDVPTGGSDWILSSLKADAEGLDCLKRTMTLGEARDVMRQTGRSNMPVFFIEEDKRSFVGNVSFKTLFLNTGADDMDALDNYIDTNVPLLETNEPLSSAVEQILQSGFIYGRSPEREVVQIYTVYDVAMWLNSISATYLRINEAEEIIRNLLKRFSPDKIESWSKDRRPLSEISSQSGAPLFLDDDIRGTQQDDTVNNLTFAQYMKCFSQDEVWHELTVGPCPEYAEARDLCLRSLNELRKSRNSVMHSNGRAELEGGLTRIAAALAWLRSLQERQ